MTTGAMVLQFTNNRRNSAPFTNNRRSSAPFANKRRSRASSASIGTVLRRQRTSALSCIVSEHRHCRASSKNIVTVVRRQRTSALSCIVSELRHCAVLSLRTTAAVVLRSRTSNDSNTDHQLERFCFLVEF